MSAVPGDFGIDFFGRPAPYAAPQVSGELSVVVSGLFALPQVQSGQIGGLSIPRRPDAIVAGRVMIDERMIVFTAEMMMRETERGLLAALKDNPTDGMARGAYVDFLLDNGRTLAAEMIRNGWTPGRP